MTRQIGIPTLIVVLGIVVLAWLFVVSRSTPVPPPPAPPPLPNPTPAPVPDRGAFYRTQIEPICLAHEKRNREATRRVVKQIESDFERYSKGIQPFAKDLTSWGTRLRVLANMPRDYWNGSEEDRRNARLVQEKFEKHILSEASLNDDLQQVFVAFREELGANRNTLMASVHAAVSDSDFAEIPLPDFEEYAQEVHARLLQHAEGRAKDSVYHGLATFVAADLGSKVAVAIVARLLTSAAVSAGSAGGAMGAGAGGGGALGTLGGPAGVAIGIGVGVVVGVIVDWWMTARLEHRLADEFQTYLDGVRHGLLDGTVDENGNRLGGIREALREFVGDVNNADTVVLHRAIVGEAP